MFIPLAVVAFSALTACGQSAPPARELADEMIDSLTDTEASPEAKACMHAEVAKFELTEQQLVGFKDFDDVAEKAAGGNETALEIMADFEAALASCN